MCDVQDWSVDREWLQSSEKEVREKVAAVAPVREEVAKLRASLCAELGLAQVVCDGGWNIAHFRGCLQSFQSLARQHPDHMAVLRGDHSDGAQDSNISWFKSACKVTSSALYNMEMAL